jgi:hypothetical protein
MINMGERALEGGSPNDFQSMLRKELELWKKIATDAKGSL